MSEHIKIYIFVGLGGMIGTVSRYGISLLMSGLEFFPWSTLFVNLSGSFLLTFILFNNDLKNKLDHKLLTALTVGIIGSFTTFSAVAFESVQLWHNSIVTAILYVLLTVFGSLGCCYGAYLLTKKWQVYR